MSRRSKIAVVLSVAVIAGVLAFCQNRFFEPQHEGTPISAWLDDWAANKATDYRTAVREIGTDGLPCVVGNLARNDSKWHKKYGELQPKLPLFLRRIIPAQRPSLKVEPMFFGVWDQTRSPRLLRF
jgi:hypothetical protein